MDRATCKFNDATVAEQLPVRRAAQCTEPPLMTLSPEEQNSIGTLATALPNPKKLQNKESAVLPNHFRTMLVNSAESDRREENL